MNVDISSYYYLGKLDIGATGLTEEVASHWCLQQGAQVSLSTPASTYVVTESTISADASVLCMQQSEVPASHYVEVPGVLEYKVGFHEDNNN